MTHDELLAEIDQWLTHSEIAKRQPNKAINVLKALRAVVELHKPLLVKDYENDTDWLECQECSGNGFNAHYPCPTIQAIEKELG